jgi:hypothetical protein
VFLILCLPMLAAHTSATDADRVAYKIFRAPDDLTFKVDGNLDEAIWQDRISRGNMVVIEPDTLADTVHRTETFFFYNDKGLYVGVANYQDNETLLARLSSRDRFIRRDGVSLTLDSSGEGLYGYWFSVNLGGTLQDGTVIPERQFSNQWDGAWDGASAETDFGWTAEMFIPWSTMSMPETATNIRKMGYYLSRFVSYRGERWAYPGLPRTKSTFMSALQPIEFENISPKQQLTWYPYASSSYDRTVEGPDSYKSGFDVFWRPTSNMQLTATVNPDFGNVESDNVVVNLSSFENFFPERRPFFLEGQEIFNTSPRARQGRGQRGTPTSLIYTRRIGSSPVTPDVPDLDLGQVEENQPSELFGAAKFTGQAGNWRYGVLTAFEEDTNLEGDVNGTPIRLTQDGRDFGAGRFLYEDTSRGDRRSIGWLTTHVARPQGDATVHGFDAHYLSQTGKWQADLQLFASDVAEETGKGGFLDLAYVPERGKRHSLAMDVFDDSVDINDFGFLRRNDQRGITYGYNRDESDIEGLQSRATRFRLVNQRNREGRVTRYGWFTNQELVFENNNRLSYELNYFPKRWEDRDSEGNGTYRIDPRWQAGLSYGTDESRPLSVEVGALYREEDLDGGKTMEYELELAWRPSDRFSVELDLTYEDKDGWLIHRSGREFTTFQADFWRPQLEIDFFLSARQQFRVTAQWAGIKADEQERFLVPLRTGDLVPDTTAPGANVRDFTISRITFQARYRWELAPLSDLFLVYTRGSDIDSMPENDFSELLSDAWTEPLIDIFVVKLRYRLGS